MTTSLSEFEHRVCQAQIDYVSNKTKPEGNKTEGNSEESYGKLYPYVQKYANILVGKNNELFKDVVVPELNPKKISKTDKIKMDNTVRMISDFFSPKRNVFSQPAEIQKIPSLLLQSNNLELKVVGFCYIFYSYIIKNTSSIFIYSVIISVQKFLKYLKTLLDSNIIPRVVEDLEYYCNKVIKLSKYNGATLQEQAPELITMSPFDVYIPQFPIDPYPTQKELYQMFSNAEFTQNGGLVFLSTATNSGKTFSVVGLSKKIDLLRKYINIKLLFSCAVDSVRNKVEELLKATDIPYAVIREEKCPTQGCQNYFACKTHFGSCIYSDFNDLYTLYDPTLREELVNNATNRKILELEGFTIVKKGNRNKNDSWRVAILDPETNIITKNPTGSSTKRDFSVIIAPPHLAVSYLIRDGDTNRGETALFLDEFTIGATDINNETLYDHMNLISNAPKWTFLSNANFVGDERMTPFLVNHQKTFSNSKMYNITSPTVYTCSTITTHSGMNVLPHYNCKNKQDFSLKLKNILRNQFKGRMYNVLALKNMYTHAKSCIIYHFTLEDEDGEDEVDEKSIKFFTDKLPNIDSIFNNVDNLYPDNIRKLSIEILQVIESIPESITESITENIPEDDPEVSPHAIFSFYTSTKGLNTKLSLPEYNGGMNLIGSISPREYTINMFSELLTKIKSKTSLNKLYSEYEKAFDNWESAYNKVSSLKYKDEQDKLIAISEVEDTRPSLSFPEEFQIGTKTYSSKQAYRTPIQIANIDFMRMKDEDMVLLLFAGIGIYDENEKDKLYLQTLFNLGIKGQLAFIVSNVSYGIDYPFSKVYIDGEFSKTKSMNEVYQLLSRGGRGQMNNLAKIFISDQCAEKIYDIEEEGDAIEVSNMITRFNNLI